MFGGRCTYCGELLPEAGGHEDHVEPIYRKWKCGLDANGDYTGRTIATGECSRPEKDTIDNRWPASSACNLFKGVFTIEPWRKVFALQVERARRRSFNFRVAERFGLVQVTGQPVVFHIEKGATADHESSVPEDSVRSHL
jgi:hypothetical protein